MCVDRLDVNARMGCARWGGREQEASTLNVSPEAVRPRPHMVGMEWHVREPIAVPCAGVPVRADGKRLLPAYGVRSEISHTLELWYMPMLACTVA